MVAISASTPKIYRYEFSKLNWEKNAQRHSMKQKKLELQSANLVWS